MQHRGRVPSKQKWEQTSEEMTAQSCDTCLLLFILCVYYEGIYNAIGCFLSYSIGGSFVLSGMYMKSMGSRIRQRRISTFLFRKKTDAKSTKK